MHASVSGIGGGPYFEVGLFYMGVRHSGPSKILTTTFSVAVNTNGKKNIHILLGRNALRDMLLC